MEDGTIVEHEVQSKALDVLGFFDRSGAIVVN